MKNEKFKIIADPRLLDLIGASMYTNCSKAIGEIVVNAYDADAKDVFIDVDTETIVVSDNGTGMTPEMIREKYLRFGGDQKKEIIQTPIFGRLPVGDKGIGKWAGLGIARRMCVITQKDGFKTTLILDFDELNKFRDLSEIELPYKIEKCDKEQQGTKVILSKLLPKTIVLKTLRDHLSRDLPMDENINYFVNNVLCSRAQAKAEISIPVNEIVKPIGLITGNVLLLSKGTKGNIPGIWTRVKGKIIGKPSLYGSTAYTHFVSYTHLISGELNVDGLSDIIKTDREGFNEDSELFKVYSAFALKKIVEIFWMKFKSLKDNKKRKMLSEEERALKNIIETFNSLQKEKYRDKTFIDISLKINKLKERKELEIYDKPARVELNSIIGIGDIKIMDRKYKVVVHPCGTDETECLISDKINAICINQDHPGYVLAKKSDNIKFFEYYIFNAITLAYAFKVCETPQEMYKTITDFMKEYIISGAK